MPMSLFSLLSLYDREVVPTEVKVHLASGNAREDLLQLYVRGEFEDWQRQQGKRNFERRLVMSLMKYPRSARWLFVGVFEVNGSAPSGHGVLYALSERESCRDLRGRVVVEFEREFRNSYPNGETVDTRLRVREILPEKYSLAEFPGYRHVHVSKVELDTLVRQKPPSWVAALSSVAGVYLISDTKDGELYVGSATGEGGLWQRWVSYADTGHGGNKLLKELLGAQGEERAQDFHFSILEIADIHDSEAELVQRESHWKRVLLTRDHGLNAN